MNFKFWFNRMEHGYTDEEVISMYHSEKKISEIKHTTGKSVGELYRILHNNNIHPNRLKTNHQNVLDFASSGLSITQIAELTGYTPRNVRYILGDKWLKQE